VATDTPLAPDPEGAAHVPVLLDEVLQLLQVQADSLVIDGTLGGGGHTRRFLEHSAPNGKVLGIDADPAALRRTRHLLADLIAQGRLVVVQGRLEDIAATAQANGFGAVDAILLDLGLSTFQLETAERGFAFAAQGPLDMRFDPQQGPSAGDIVNTWDEEEIANLIFRYGEEHRSRAIARALVRSRPIESTTHLAAVVEKAVGGRRGARIHPATRTFQALRIAVNQELEQIETALPQCLHLLRPGGRLAVISFHSLEDRIVKQWMAHEGRTWNDEPLNPYGGTPHTPSLQIVTRKPVTPGDAEITVNPRSRSAKLRVAQKNTEPAPNANLSPRD
jgi:16S rRNA (cytosine1402-N4)-methyltransferase